MKRLRAGCSTLFAFLVLGSLAAAIYLWPSYVDSRGDQTTGAISEKREVVRVHFATWFREFEIVAAYRIPGQPMEHHAICDVVQPTYDSLHVGNTVAVHYLSTLLSQPFIPATHLSPCTSDASIGSNPVQYHKLGLVFGSLLAILFLWRVFRIKIAAWLLVPWFFFFVAYLVVPHAEPAPAQPRPFNATVAGLTTISTLNPGRTRSMTLPNPYQIVRLQYTPPGLDTPVVAIDEIDLNSISGLQKGQTVPIEYDATDPRVARIVGGTRLFPEHTTSMLVITGVVVFIILFVLFVIRGLFRLFMPHRRNRVARLNALLQRSRRARF